MVHSEHDMLVTLLFLGCECAVQLGLFQAETPPETAVAVALGEKNREEERSGAPQFKLIVNCI